MKHIRRINSFLLALVMVFSMIPYAQAHAEETELEQIVEIPMEETTVPAETESVEEAAEEVEPSEENVSAVLFTVAENAPRASEIDAISDFSEYTFQLYSASNGGATGPLYIDCYYLNYSWWKRITYSNNVNDRFVTRVHFEKDSSTGKYRLYYYGVHSSDQSLYTGKYYLTGATVPTADRTEGNEFYYGDLYGYEYIDITSSASEALLWEVTSAGNLKTQYKGKTHYLWTTTTPYATNARYVLRLRTTTTAKGNYGIPVALSAYNWFSLSNVHTHTPGTKQTTGVEAATCIKAQRTGQAIFCTKEDCGAKLASNGYYTGTKDPNNHTELVERVVNEQPANCQTPYTYEIEVYCTGCKCVTETKGPFQEGEMGNHVPAEAVQENVITGSCVTQGSYESVVYCDLCSEEISRSTVVTGFAAHKEEINAPVAPGCTSTGLTEGKHCSVCGEVLVAQEVVDALGHTEAVDEAVAPTCTDTGLTEGKHCSVCGEVLGEQEIVPATGEHQFLDGSCVNCGLRENLIGDLNGDGAVDDRDVEYLLWYVLFPDMFTIEGDADFDKDGNITDSDVETLLWHVLFPDMFPLN